MNFVCCKINSVPKMKSFVDQDQKVTLEDGEDEDPKVYQVPEGKPDHQDLPVNMDQWDHKDQLVKRELAECRVPRDPPVPEVRRVRKAHRDNLSRLPPVTASC